MPAYFEVYKDSKGEYRFRLKAANGEIIIGSEGYASKQNCYSGIDSVKINAAAAAIIELNPDKELIIACEKGDIDAARKALNQGANPNARDKEGEPAMKEAVESGNLDLVKLLVRHKADMNLADIHGETPLHEAADEGHENIVLYLIKEGVKIDPKDNKGNTPLHKALVEGHEKVALLLVRAGAKPNNLNYSSQTPLQIAAEKGIDIANKSTSQKKTILKTVKKPAIKTGGKSVKKKKR